MTAGTSGRLLRGTAVQNLVVASTNVIICRLPVVGCELMGGTIVSLKIV